MNRIIQPLHFLLAAVASLLLTACGGGGNAFPIAPLPGGTAGTSETSSSSSSTVVTGASQTETPPPPTYAVGGTLAGLPANEKLVLLDNGGDALTVTGSGAFSFATRAAFNAGYAVTVGTQPSWYNCAVTNGSGTAAADVASIAVACTAAQAQVTTVGDWQVAGARIYSVAMDPSGNFYAADNSGNRIFKMTPDGVVTTWAGPNNARNGSADGNGSVARFNGPYDVATDASGNVYVSEYGNRKIRKITPDDVVGTLAGSGVPGSADGPANNASFFGPSGMAVDAADNVYVAEANNNQIRKITADGVVSTLAGAPVPVGAPLTIAPPGWADGTGADASFNSPLDVAVDSAGNVYVADLGNSEIRKITPAGVVTTFAGSTTSGSADGTGADASFSHPIGLAVDAVDNVYVVDLGNYEIRKITPDGVVTTLAGSRTSALTDGVGTAASFEFPRSIVVDAGGNLYVSDESGTGITGNVIRKISPIRQ